MPTATVEPIRRRLGLALATLALAAGLGGLSWLGLSVVRAVTEAGRAAPTAAANDAFFQG